MMIDYLTAKIMFLFKQKNCVNKSLAFSSIRNSTLHFIVLIILISGSFKTTFSQGINKNEWAITASDTANYTPAYLGNGIIGIRSQINGLGAGRVIINGLYDKSPLGDYVRLINSYNPLSISIDFGENKSLIVGSNMRKWQQTMDLKEAILITSYIYDNKLKVKTQMVALRNLPMAGMVVYDFEALEDISFTVQNKVNIPNRQQTLGLYKPNLAYGMYSLSTTIKEKIPVMSTAFPTETGGDCIAGANTFFFDQPTPKLTYTKNSSTSHQVAFSINLKKGEKYSFCLLSSFTHSKLTNDPYNDAVRICSRDYNLGYKHLLQNHTAAWAKLWKSDIIIEGDNESQIDARLALYSLYASIATGFGLSIPPCGLAETGWGGHIFWDAELWMFPPLLAMQPAFANSMIDFRINNLQQAKKRAAQFGYIGAMYPWESDLEGNECTPIAYKLDMNEHHVTADVAIAAWNYFQVTKDQAWLQQKGYPLIKEIADFWVSRVSIDSTGKYHIKNVVGPDEYFEDVDDDAFTNGAVKVVMDAAIKSAALVKENPSPEWKKVHENLVILKHPSGYTLQNAQYKQQRIKQADVNLLAYPLELITDKAEVNKDLEFYEPKIDVNGPSMSYSVLAVSHARLGNSPKAFELFQKAFRLNRKPPFGFISEKPRPSGTVFCTGYGGMLQTIIFGFAGMKIGKDGLNQQKANLPPNWKKLTIKMDGKEDIICIGQNGK